MHHIKKINIEPNRNVELQVSRVILKDFLDFKTKNELTFCNLIQKKIQENLIEVNYTCTFKNFESFNDYNTFINKFDLFIEDNNDINVYISKVTCQENVYIVEVTVSQTYKIKYQ